MKLFTEPTTWSVGVYVKACWNVSLRSTKHSREIRSYRRYAYWAVSWSTLSMWPQLTIHTPDITERYSLSRSKETVNREVGPVHEVCDTKHLFQYQLLTCWSLIKHEDHASINNLCCQCLFCDILFEKKCLTNFTRAPCWLYSTRLSRPLAWVVLSKPHIALSFPHYPQSPPYVSSVSLHWVKNHYSSMIQLIDRK